MKAIVYHRYGSPNVLALTEMEKPTPKEDEVLLKAHAASANPADWRLMRGTPFLARFEAGLPKPKNTILGSDVAGRVEAVGRSVTQFQPGDEVFGDTFRCGWGGFAEYVAIPENRIALKPANLTFEAAAVPLAAFTALQGLRAKGQIQSGQKVLIDGASGDVGTFAVQIAKSFGAEVTGVCGTRNLDLVRSIGADYVIDYTLDDFTKSVGHRTEAIARANALNLLQGGDPILLSSRGPGGSRRRLLLPRPRSLPPPASPTPPPNCIPRLHLLADSAGIPRR